MPAAPKINRSCISVSGNKLSISEIDEREIEIVRGGGYNGRANSKQGAHKRPNIFEGIVDIKEGFSTNNRTVREPPPIKRDNKLGNSIFYNLPNTRGENIEKTNIREKRDNEDINKEDTIRKRERFNKGTRGMYFGKCFIKRYRPYIIEGDRSANNYP
jgi:hypothetical protein